MEDCDQEENWGQSDFDSSFDVQILYYHKHD